MISDKPSPPSDMGSLIILKEDDACSKPFSIALHTSKLLRLPLNLSGAMMIFIQFKKFGKKNTKR
jgi:hypothetical protein